MRPKRGIVYHKARNTPPPLLMPTPDVVTEADNAALIAAAHGVPAVALERKVDLDQLRLNYRRAMNERQATTAAVEKKIQHQTQLLRRLEEEQAMLRKRISAETALTNTPQDAALAAQLEQKQQELEQLTATLQQQEQQVQSAEKHRAQREETLIQLRNRLSLATQRRTSSEYIDKTTAALERKLELAQNARSEIEAQNTKMREDISELLRKRDEFVHEREELQDQTLQVKQDAQQAVAVSQAAYERRELLRSTLSTLLADEEAGIQEHNAAYRSVTEALNATLAQEAVSAAPPERRPVTGEIRDRSLSPPARNVSSAARNEEIRLQLQMLAEQVGVPIEDLARTYTDREDKNYGLYGFASELEVEVERVTERLNLLRTQVAQRDSNVQQIETEDIQQVADTQKRLEQIETDTVAATQRRDQAVQALDQAVKAATTLADQLGVESAMDGGSADAPVILGRIEDAVTAMLLKVGGLVHRGALPPAVFISRQDIESERLAQTGILSHGAGQAGSGSNIALPSTETRDQDGVLKSTTIADAAYAQEDEVFEAVVGKGQGRRSSIPLTLDDIRNLVSTSMFTENDVLEEELA